MAIKKNRSHKSKDINDHIVQTGTVKEDGVGDWEVSEQEIHSTTLIEDDDGHGKPVVIRSFDFKANPQAFFRHIPTKQELFNAHYKQIEVFLMKDGLKVMPEVNPQVKVSKDKTMYRIVVGAEPMRGFLVNDRPQTLSEITNAKLKSVSK